MNDPNFVCDACGAPLDDNYHDSHLPDCPNFGKRDHAGGEIAPCDCDVQYCPACCPECKRAELRAKLDELIGDFQSAAESLAFSEEWGMWGSEKENVAKARAALIDFVMEHIK